MHEDKLQSFLEADTIVFGGHSQVCPKYPKQQVFEISLQYFKKEGRHEVGFLHADKQTFLQVDTIKICEYASHAQSTQNNKFAKSLQYLKKEVRGEVHFCTDKHQSIQKVDTIIFD